LHLGITGHGKGQQQGQAPRVFPVHDDGDAQGFDLVSHFSGFRFSVFGKKIRN
jgi:hypothetical protein